VIVSADITGLAVGTYNATITISATGASNTPQTVTVTLNYLPIYRCEVKSGWNLISIPAQLVDNTIEVALQSIAGNFNSVWRWVCDPTYPNGGYWKLYVPGKPIISDLKTFHAGDGYWIDMKDAAVLTLSVQAASGGPIQVKQGWNMLGYNSLTAKPIEDALSSIASHVNSVWAWKCDPSYAGGGYWMLYDPDKPLISDLKTLKPGMGLWMDAIDACEWSTN
jgi:hypothetical protein